MPVAFSVLMLAVLLGVVSASQNVLGPYKVSDVTVSGFSSGAYMAVQMHIAYSSIVNGSAVFAGGPFYCAQGNLNYAENKCMKTTLGLPNIDALIGLTNTDAATGQIDPPINLADDRVYIFSGKDDSVVSPKVVDSLQTYYVAFIQTNNLVADFAVTAEHVFPTLDQGEECGSLISPYIGKCNFDGAGAALNTLYSNQLKPSTPALPANLLSFDQTPFITDKYASIGDTGYIYVPTACQNGASCHLHVSFHACEQDLETVGNKFASMTGLNNWGEANDIIVLYPFVKKSKSNPSNPNGCWDWWGYTNASYGVKKGAQMKFVRDLISAFSGL